MNQTDLDPETQGRYAATCGLRDAIVAACNQYAEHPVNVTFFALISALADFIATAPEEQQAGIYKHALEMLEQAYVVNLTKGNL